MSGNTGRHWVEGVRKVIDAKKRNGRSSYYQRLKQRPLPPPPQQQPQPPSSGDIITITPITLEHNSGETSDDAEFFQLLGVN
jgi:hypothetical protein